MRKKYVICFTTIVVVSAAIILFIFVIKNDRELLMEDLWKGKEISQIVIECDENINSSRTLSEEEMASFFNDFGSEKIIRLPSNNNITGWTHGIRMYDKNGNQVVFMTFLGTRISVVDNGYYQCTASAEDLYNKLASYE